MAATVDQTGVITIQFVNVHGDVYNTVASTATSDTDPSYTGTWTDEYGRLPRQHRPIRLPRR